MGAIAHWLKELPGRTAEHLVAEVAKGVLLASGSVALTSFFVAPSGWQIWATSGAVLAVGALGFSIRAFLSRRKEAAQQQFLGVRISAVIARSGRPESDLSVSISADQPIDSRLAVTVAGAEATLTIKLCGTMAKLPLENSGPMKISEEREGLPRSVAAPRQTHHAG